MDNSIWRLMKKKEIKPVIGITITTELSDKGVL